MDHQFWINWLKAASALVVGFGLLIALAAHPATAAPTMLLADLLIWPFDGNPTLPEQTARLVSAIAGGVMAGWGVMFWMVASQVLPDRPEVGRRLILASLLVWFVIDSTGSLAAGVPLNIAGNLLFLAAFLIPLRMLGRADTQSAPA